MAARSFPTAAGSIQRLFSPARRQIRRPSNFFTCAPTSRLPRPEQPTQLPRQRYCVPSSTRYAHTIPRPRQPNKPRKSAPSSTPSQPCAPEAAAGSAESAAESAAERVSRTPHYELTFTCVPCGGRSRHTVSKQGYHHGSVLVTCPGCRNRHVISDHLGIFGDRRGVTVEDLMQERGRLVKRGALGEDGDVEFWEDGTTTVRGAADGDLLVLDGTAGSDGERNGEQRTEAGDAEAPGTSFAPGAVGSRTSA